MVVRRQRRLRAVRCRIDDHVVGASTDGLPQLADGRTFYERFGSAGYAALETVLDAARSAGLLVIADVKRGDVGTSVEAYAQAWLTPGSPLEADAMTASAFQGVGSLRAPLELAAQHDKGVFVLSATSNPEAEVVQLARTESGDSVAQSIVREVADWNAAHAPGSLGSAGVVIGATVRTSDYGINLDEATGSPILAPGFGHQGASIGVPLEVEVRAHHSDDSKGLAVELDVAADNRRIIHVEPVAVQLDEVGEDEPQVVERERPLAVARHLHALERCQRAIDLRAQLGELLLERRNRVVDTELAIARQLEAAQPDATVADYLAEAAVEADPSS